MAHVANVVCPRCGAALKLAAAVPAGTPVKCPHCGNAFAVRADAVRPAAPIPVAVPYTPPPAISAAARGESERVNIERLGVVIGIALLYLIGGALLMVYCISLNARQSEAGTIESTQSVAGTVAPGPANPGRQIQAPAPPRPKAQTVQVDAAEQLQINKAITNGVWYLKGAAQPDGTWTNDIPNVGPAPVGVASLAGLTLLECGVPASDAVIKNAAAFVRKQAPEAPTPRDTYELALAILFLDRLGDKKDDSLLQFLALRLVAGQRPNDGGWDYGCPALERADTNQLLYLLKSQTQALDNWRSTALKGNPWPAGRSDNSNTQFAVLALWVAGRHNVDIDKPAAEVEKRFRSSQQDDGHWMYSQSDGTDHNSPWATMTCSGLLGLAVAHGASKDPAEKKQKPLDDPAIQKALSMLASEIDKPDASPATELYYLWSLERVGVLYNLSKIDGKDWYGWGTRALLPTQQVDGAWAGQWLTGNNTVVATCFALLFLKQANLAQDLTTKLELLEKK